MASEVFNLFLVFMLAISNSATYLLTCTENNKPVVSINKIKTKKYLILISRVLISKVHHFEVEAGVTISAINT